MNDLKLKITLAPVTPVCQLAPVHEIYEILYLISFLVCIRMREVLFAGHSISSRCQGTLFHPRNSALQLVAWHMP